MNDLRFAVKSLARTPGFTLIAIVTLGLGIGANTSMFSILNGYMLRPAPYADREHLERIYRTTRQERRGGISPADYLDLKSQMSGYGEIATYAASDMSLSEAGKPAEMASGLRVSANLFATLGTLPEKGRSFRPDEDSLGNHRVLVISHRYWQNRFGGDAQIVGRKVRVDGEPYEIVGVLPASFSDWRHLSSVDVFRPLGLTEKEIRDRHPTRLRLIGRRSDTVPRAQAEALLLALAGGLCAVIVALWTFDWFAVASAEPGGNGVGVNFTLDWRVLGWMFGACVFTALAFGVAPAHFVHRLDLNSTLKSGSRGTTADRGHRRFR